MKLKDISKRELATFIIGVGLLTASETPHPVAQTQTPVRYRITDTSCTQPPNGEFDCSTNPRTPPGFFLEVVQEPGRRCESLITQEILYYPDNTPPQIAALTHWKAKYNWSPAQAVDKTGYTMGTERRDQWRTIHRIYGPVNVDVLYQSGFFGIGSRRLAINLLCKP